MIRLLLALMLLLCFVPAAPAAETMHPFENPQQEARYERLTGQLRCLVCQGQSIDDSGSKLAKDMRDKVFELLAAGRTDQEVIDYMTSRYGDFVLYRPPVEPKTWLLWFGPFVLIVFGVTVVLVMARRRSSAGRAGLDEGERDRLAALLADDDRGGRP